MNNRRRGSRLAAAVAGLALPFALLTSVSPASALDPGKLTILPTTGNGLTTFTFVADGQCPDPSEDVVIRVSGGDPATPGAYIAPAEEKNFNSTTVASFISVGANSNVPAPHMEWLGENTWSAWASTGSPILTALKGTYDLTLLCATSGKTFVGQAVWTGTGTGTGATYTMVTVGVPGAPTAVTAAAGNGSATVSWTAPAGSSVTSYTVTASPGGQTCATASTSCAVTGLTNGTAYTFSVVASNGSGEGPASAASAAVVPRTVPGAPRTVVATGGQDTRALVKWAAPLSNGGAAITSYTVTSFSSGRPVRTCVTSTLSCTVTGLVNGYRYTFTVKATNAAGAGASSAASASVIPLGSILQTAGKVITISGTARVGFTVTRVIPSKTFYTSSGSLTAKYSGFTYTYQWKRNGVSISRATASSYRLTSLDRGKTITVVVTAKKFGFRAKSVTSKSIRVS